MKRILGALTLTAILAIAAPAGADTSQQVIDATIGSTVAMTSSPTATIPAWTLASTGANSISGGTVTINGNAPYTLIVEADKTRLTEYVTATSSYDSSSPKTLTSPLTVTATRSSGTAAVPGVGLAAIVGTTTALATGTGLGTDAYSISLGQPTLITDTALPSGETYHIVLTYTSASTL